MRMYIFTKRKENYMKRICKTLLLAAVIMALLAATAVAADFTHCADAHKDHGRFSGRCDAGPPAGSGGERQGARR